MTILAGTAYWTHIQEPNNKGEFASNKYEIVLGNLNAENITKIKALGFASRIQNKDNEQGTFIKLKSDRQPTLIDKDKNTISPIPLIGNGSKVLIQPNVYHVPKFGKQIGINSIMLLDLVEYKVKGGGDLTEFDDELPDHFKG